MKSLNFGPLTLEAQSNCRARKALWCAHQDERACTLLLTQRQPQACPSEARSVVWSAVCSSQFAACCLLVPVCLQRTANCVPPRHFADYVALSYSLTLLLSFPRAQINSRASREICHNLFFSSLPNCRSLRTLHSSKEPAFLPPLNALFSSSCSAVKVSGLVFAYPFVCPSGRPGEQEAAAQQEPQAELHRCLQASLRQTWWHFN